MAEEYSPDTLQAAAVQLMPAAHVAPDPHAISKDTLRLNPKLEWMDRAFKSRLFRATYMGVPLIAGGLIVKHQDTKFRKLRNDFLPHFRRPVDGIEGGRDTLAQFVGAHAVERYVHGDCHGADSGRTETYHASDAPRRYQPPQFSFWPYGYGLHDGHYAH